jgi:hypothetical protein
LHLCLILVSLVTMKRLSTIPTTKTGLHEKKIEPIKRSGVLIFSFSCVGSTSSLFKNPTRLIHSFTPSTTNHCILFLFQVSSTLIRMHKKSIRWIGWRLIWIWQIVAVIYSPGSFSWLIAHFTARATPQAATCLLNFLPLSQFYWNTRSIYTCVSSWPLKKRAVYLPRHFLGG